MKGFSVDLGTILLILALIFVFIDFFLLLLRRSRSSGSLTDPSSASFPLFAALILILLAYFRLALAFLNDEFALKEVYSYSSSGLSPLFKFADTWIGSGSSLLFLCLLFALSYAWLRLKLCKIGNYSREKEQFSRMFFLTADIILLLLLVVVLVEHPFERFSVNPREGYGLNPLLQNVWVVVHPPVLFLGYSLTLLAFALSLAGMLAEAFEGTQESGGGGSGGGGGGSGGVVARKEKERALRLTACAAWLFLSLGIALGGWWSYEVLGWGGYWAWDPVETASLMPWLALTAYFHLHSRRKDLAREFSLLLAFFMVIFASALTRGGLLESVHAFAASALGPVLLIFGFSFALIFLYLRFRLQKPIYAFDVDFRSLHSLSLFVAFWSLLVALLVCFLGEAMPMLGELVTGISMNTEPEFFTMWCYPPTIAFVVALAGCNLSLSVKRFALLTALVTALGVVLAFLGVPLPNALANFGLPFLIFAGVSVLLNFVRKISVSAMRVGTMLIHLAIILILVGVFVSSSAEMDSGDIPATLNSDVNALGTSIEISTCEVFASNSFIYSPKVAHFLPEFTAFKIYADVKTGGSVHKSEIWMFYYPNYGIVSKPLIISTPTEDVYIFMQYTNSTYEALFNAMFGSREPPENFIIRVKRIPLVSLIWAGVVAMSVGMSLILLEAVRRRRAEAEEEEKE
ncbi:MAG: cytochrome c biogenesis protein CcsA [Candidatus Methanospirare jalkutatii]|nr:MAG: cytochrome c biogenesis protein CcsA [Candidatus Methanospirare jalkutatii]